MPELISSAANPLVRRIRKLGERKVRQQEGAFWVEGGQPVWRAVDSGWPLDCLVIAPDLLHHDAELAMVDEVEASGGRVARLTAELFTRLCERDSPGGIAAIVRGRIGSAGSLTVADDATIVALENVGNPGNLGTIVRTADAAGAAGVVLVGPGADPFDPRAVKASMGSIFAVPVARVADVSEFAAWAQAVGAEIVATSGYAQESHWDAHFRTPTVLLFGAEGPGLSEEALGVAGRVVRIPMTGSAESLNLSTAVAVLLYEARKGFLRR